MDLVHDKTCIIEEEEEEEEEQEEEDRISNLPDDIIHRILSFLDMKYAVQTSVLSPKWKHIWILTRHLNLNSRMFRTLPSFANFVRHVLYLRNNQVEVSKAQITFTGAATPLVLKYIISYAYMHNVSELNITWLTTKFHRFPYRLFSSHTLKHLTLVTSDQSDQFDYVHKTSCIPKVSWNFPELETMYLSGMHLGNKRDASLDLFSKCVNLRDLTLHKCCMDGLKIFNIYAPELINLTITDATSYPDVFNVVAPKLKTLTASIMATNPQYPSKFDCLQFSTEAFDSVEKVDLSLSLPDYEQRRYIPFLLNLYRMRYVPLLLNLFPKFRRTKSLVVNLEILQTLYAWEELSREPCPFDNLECLKVNTMPLKVEDLINLTPTEVKNYFLENSPSATFISD